MDLDLTGRTLGGRFHLLSPLGEGGYGAVYLAEQVTMGRQIAVKVIHPKLADSQDFVERFEREARVASRLKHPNTVIYFDFGRDGDVHYLAMELVEGRTLRTEVGQSGPMSLERAAHIAIQICGALSEAHAVGMVHRDLKPANILLTERGGDSDFAKVIDFGLAKMVQGTADMSRRDLTAEGVLVGTPAYMAPEQIRGHDVDNRCDIYALGVILFVLLTGQKPYDGDTPLGTAVMHLTEEIPLVRSINPGVPVDMEALVSQCLAKEPAGRPPDVDAVAEALEDIVSAHGGDTGRRRRRRQPAPAPTATLDPTPPTRSGRPLGHGVETMARPRPASRVSRPLLVGLLATLLVAIGAAVALLGPGASSEAGPGPAIENLGSAALANAPGPEGPAQPSEAAAPPAAAGRPVAGAGLSDHDSAVTDAIGAARIRLNMGLVESQLAIIQAGADTEVVQVAEVTEPEPRERRRRRSERQPTAETGRLRITARPWGRVTCNDRDLGRTPVDQELPVGEYECRIVSPQGEEAVRRVTVEGDDSPAVVVRFDRRESDAE